MTADVGADTRAGARALASTTGAVVLDAQAAVAKSATILKTRIMAADNADLTTSRQVGFSPCLLCQG